MFQTSLIWGQNWEEVTLQHPPPPPTSLCPSLVGQCWWSGSFTAGHHGGGRQRQRQCTGWRGHGAWQWRSSICPSVGACALQALVWKGLGPEVASGFLFPSPPDPLGPEPEGLWRVTRLTGPGRGTVSQLLSHPQSSEFRGCC